MVMTDRRKYEIIQNMSKDEHFRATLRVNEKMIRERYDMELTTRFICLRNETVENISNVRDFGEYLNERIIALINDPQTDWDEEERIFRKTFEYLDNAMSDTVFCKYYADVDRFKGGLSIGAFEIIALGLGRRGGNISADFDLTNRVKALWHQVDSGEVSWRGNSAGGRLARTLPLSDNFYED